MFIIKLFAHLNCFHIYDLKRSCSAFCLELFCTHTKMRLFSKLLTDRRVFLKMDKDSKPQIQVNVCLGTHCCWRAIHWGRSLWWEATPNLSGRSPRPVLLCTLAPCSASSLQRVLSFHWASFWISCKRKRDTLRRDA